MGRDSKGLFPALIIRKHIASSKLYLLPVHLTNIFSAVCQWVINLLHDKNISEFKHGKNASSFLIWDAVLGYLHIHANATLIYNKRQRLKKITLFQLSSRNQFWNRPKRVIISQF